MMSFNKTRALSHALQGNQNARKHHKPNPTVSVERLLEMADRCTAKGDQCDNPDHGLQWRFAGMLLKLIADDATIPPNDPRRALWDSTYHWLRERNSRAPSDPHAEGSPSGRGSQGEGSPSARGSQGSPSDPHAEGSPSAKGSQGSPSDPHAEGSPSGRGSQGRTLADLRRIIDEEIGEYAAIRANEWECIGGGQVAAPSTDPNAADGEIERIAKFWSEADAIYACSMQRALRRVATILAYGDGPHDEE